MYIYASFLLIMLTLGHHPVTNRPHHRHLCTVSVQRRRHLHLRRLRPRKAQKSLVRQMDPRRKVRLHPAGLQIPPRDAIRYGDPRIARSVLRPAHMVDPQTGRRASPAHPGVVVVVVVIVVLAAIFLPDTDRATAGHERDPAFDQGVAHPGSSRMGRKSPGPGSGPNYQHYHAHSGERLPALWPAAEYVIRPSVWCALSLLSLSLSLSLVKFAR